MKHACLLVAVMGCGGASTPASAPPAVENTTEVEPEEVVVGEHPPIDPAETHAVREQAIADARAAGIIGPMKSEQATPSDGAAADAPANPPPVTTGEPTPPPPSGPRIKDAIRTTIRAHIGEIRLCYEMQLMERPDLAGKTMVTFTIENDGTVSEATGSGFDAMVDACTAERIKNIRFPAGGVTTVNYPFVFRTADS